MGTTAEQAAASAALETARRAAATAAAAGSARAVEEPELDDTPRPTLRDRHGRERPDISEHARRQLAANNQDATLALMGVLQQNFDLREERRELNTEIERLKPKTGEIRLTREQVQLWQGYLALNLTPDQVHGLQQKETQHSASEAARENDLRAEAGAKLLGLNPAVIRRLVRQDGLVVEIKTVERQKPEGEGTEKIEVAYVRPAATPTAALAPLGDHVAAQWEADFGLALRAPAQGAESRDEGAAAAGAPRVVPLITQAPPGRARNADVVGQTLKSRYPVPKHLVGGDERKAERD